jgi:hypothetical protein
MEAAVDASAKHDCKHGCGGSTIKSHFFIPNKVKKKWRCAHMALVGEEIVVPQTPTLESPPCSTHPYCFNFSQEVVSAVVVHSVKLKY